MDLIPGGGTKIPQATQNGQKKDTYIKNKTKQNKTKQNKTQGPFPVPTNLISSDASRLLSF